MYAYFGNAIMFVLSDYFFDRPHKRRPENHMEGLSNFVIDCLSKRSLTDVVVVHQNGNLVIIFHGHVGWFLVCLVSFPISFTSCAEGMEANDANLC